MAAGHGRDEVEDAEAAAVFRRDGGKITKNGEDVAFDGDLGNVGDNQGPFGGFQFAEEEVYVGDDTDAPALGVENLAQGGRAGRVIVEHKDADLPRGCR